MNEKKYNKKLIKSWLQGKITTEKMIKLFKEDKRETKGFSVAC